MVVKVPDLSQMSHTSTTIIFVHTNDLTVDRGRDAGKSSGELKEDIVDHMLGQSVHLLSQKFQ